MARFDALQLKGAADAAYNLVKEKILTGELAAGERLDVGQVALEMGISRTPVQDALQKLSVQGLIRVHARKGTFVTQVTPIDVAETFEVREALELKACELLAGKFDDEKATALRAINEKMKKPDLTNMERVLFNQEFHLALVEFAGNSRLTHFYSDLSGHLLMARIQPQYSEWNDPLSSVIKDHEDIIAAHAANRVDEAEAILRKHIRSTKDRFLAWSSGPRNAG